MFAITDGVPVLLYDRHPALYLIIPMTALVKDFPLKKFFQDGTDEFTLNWKPIGAELEAISSQVQSRWNSTLGQKSIIVSPELEEKMENNPELAKRLMANVEYFIATYLSTSGRSGRICPDLP